MAKGSPTRAVIHVLWISLAILLLGAGAASATSGAGKLAGDEGAAQALTPG